jgi:hypothetical protein
LISEDYADLLGERSNNFLSTSDKLQPTLGFGQSERIANKDITIIPRNEKLGLVRHTSDLYACRVGCCGAFSLFSGVALIVWGDFFYLIISIATVVPSAT